MSKKEFQEAYDYLTKIGFLIPFDDNLELYHGRNRGRRETEEWRVDPRFKNGGNLTGNRNVYAISTLSTGTKELAMDFARSRAMSDGGTPEIHRIKTDDKNAMIINRNFSMSRLSPEERSKVTYYLTVLSHFNISELSPADFRDRDAYVAVYKTLKAECTKTYICQEDVERVHKKISETRVVSKKLVEQIAGALNAKQLLISNPSIVIQKFALENEENFRHSFAVKVGDDIVSAPLNQEYIAAWLAHNHIVGAKSKVYSGTLDENIDAFYLFDLDKINTEKALGEKLQHIMSEYGEFSKAVENFASSEVVEFLSTASPRETVEYFADVDNKFKTLLKADAGVGEGFSVLEHTESVLRVFEDTFQKDIPPAMIPFMKFALSVHDMGKGWAVKARGNQKTFNDKACQLLTTQLNIDKKYSDLIRFVIGESQQYTTYYYVYKDLSALDKLKERCFDVLSQAFGDTPSPEMIDGLVGVCTMMQTCDSGAYTPQGIIRDSKSNLYYRGVNARFQQSFQEPPDLQKRAQHLKDPKVR